MKVRFFGICALAVMLWALCGCRAELVPTTTNQQLVRPPVVTGENTTTEPTETEPPPYISVQYLPAEVDNPEKLPVLKWVCLTERMYGGGVRVWSEDAAREVNELLAQKGLKFRLQFVLLTTDRFLYTTEWFSRPEAQEALQDADLIYGFLSADMIRQLLMPITEYAQGTSEPSLENAVIHPSAWYTDAQTNEIYAYQTLVSPPGAFGWKIAPNVLQEYGMNMEDLRGSFWEMDDVFRKLFEKYGNAPFLLNAGDGVASAAKLGSTEPASYFPSVLDQHCLFSHMHQIGSCFVVDYSGEVPRIVNYLERDEVKKMQAAIQRYANYLTADYDDAFLYYGYCATDSEYVDSVGNVFVPVSVPVSVPAGEGNYVSGVAAGTQYREEALTLLGLIAEDAQFRMCLFYGREGRDYKVENGYYKIATVEGKNYSLDFLSPLSYLCGLTSDPNYGKNMLSPGTNNGLFVADEGKTALETYMDDLAAQPKGVGLTFDYSGFGEELNAIQVVLEKNFQMFSTLTEEKYNQMLADIKGAGSDKIIAELQRQLDAWLADHPEWNK